MLKIDIIYNKDCLEGMKELPDKCIDAVIADMPYGVLNRKNGSAGWDRQIPLDALWEQYRRIAKPGCPIICSHRVYSRQGSCCRSPGCGGITLSGGKTV